MHFSPCRQRACKKTRSIEISMESGQKRTRNGNDMRDTKSEIRTARMNIYETQKRYQETEIIYYGLWVKPTPLIRQPLLVASPFFHLALNAGHPSWSKVTNHTSKIHKQNCPGGGSTTGYEILAFRDIVTVIFDIGSREPVLSILSLSGPYVLLQINARSAQHRYLDSREFSAIKRNIKDRSVHYWRCSLKPTEMGISPSGNCRSVIIRNEPSDGKRQRKHGYYVSRDRINNRRRTQRWMAVAMTLRIRRDTPNENRCTFSG